MTEVRMRDFSASPRELEFTADGETYQCHSEVTPDVLQEILTLTRGRLQEDFGTLVEAFELVMLPEVAQTFTPRLHKGHPKPIGMGRAAAILAWLIEEYSQRPTEPSAT